MPSVVTIPGSSLISSCVYRYIFYIASVLLTAFALCPQTHRPLRFVFKSAVVFFISVLVGMILLLLVPPSRNRIVKLIGLSESIVIPLLAAILIIVSTIIYNSRKRSS